VSRVSSRSALFDLDCLAAVGCYSRLLCRVQNKDGPCHCVTGEQTAPAVARVGEIE